MDPTTLACEGLKIGRNPDCGVIIPITSVSREHATIMRLQGRYFIEDGDGRGNKSRNHTFVNKQEISTRTALKNNDEIRICDFIANIEGDLKAGRTSALPAKHVEKARELA